VRQDSNRERIIPPQDSTLVSKIPPCPHPSTTLEHLSCKIPFNFIFLYRYKFPKRQGLVQTGKWCVLFKGKFVFNLTCQAKPSLYLRPYEYWSHFIHIIKNLRISISTCTECSMSYNKTLSINLSVKPVHRPSLSCKDSPNFSCHYNLEIAL
jgi:hypothetical protein